MGTLVTIQVVREGAESAVDVAFGWFREIEARCTRFRADSELMQLTQHIGRPVAASPILFEAMRFALLVAQETGGAFDPTVGHRMAARGFDQDYRGADPVGSAFAPDDAASFRDIEIDADRRTITLHRPLTPDLGAVAKGLAVDLAARELAPFEDFAIDAGGDLYLGGVSPSGAPWSVGIRHPRRDRGLIDWLSVSNQAVCTSGDYERRTPTGDGHHILDPRTGASGEAAASVTVVAHDAMLADALATAAFVLGPAEGIQLLHRMGVDGLILTAELERHETRGLRHAA